jgi:anti-sigma B factor antagonist
MQYRTTRENNAVVLHVTGELDCVTVSSLRPAVQALVDKLPELVVVDLGELRVIDSTGVGLLVSMHRQLRLHGGRLGLRRASGQPLAVLRLLRLDGVFTATPDADPATPPLTLIAPATTVAVRN